MSGHPNYPNSVTQQNRLSERAYRMAAQLALVAVVATQLAGCSLFNKTCCKVSLQEAQNNQEQLQFEQVKVVQKVSGQTLQFQKCEVGKTCQELTPKILEVAQATTSPQQKAPSLSSKTDPVSEQKALIATTSPVTPPSTVSVAQAQAKVQQPEQAPIENSVPLQSGSSAATSYTLYRIHFEFAKSNLDPKSIEILRVIVKNKDKIMAINLAGATDKFGNKKANELLAKQRAKVAQEFLIGEGFSQATIEVLNMAKLHSMVKNLNEESIKIVESPTSSPLPYASMRRTSVLVLMKN